MKRLFSSMVAMIFCLTLLVPSGLALDGVWHDPYGLNCIFDIMPTERQPRNPSVGETVLVRSTTWPIEPGQSVWLTYTKNGIQQQDIGADWKYNDGNNSYWEINMGSFKKGDAVTYTVFAAKDGGNIKSIGPFTFHVTDWEKIQSVTLASQSNGQIIFNGTPNTGAFAPRLSLSFSASDTLRLQLSPKGNASFDSGINDYTVTESGNNVVITTEKLRVTVTKSPYSLEVYDLQKGRLLASNGSTGMEMSWLTDGRNVIDKVREGFASPTQEQFYGFGERYNGLLKRGQVIETYVYNQYQNQGDRTYLAVPFFCSSLGYGVFLNSTFYSKFDMAASKANVYSFAADTAGDSSAMLDYYVIGGDTPADVVSGYTQISGLPQEMPKWAFGLWMSANEWNTQSDVIGAMNNSINYDIPATVVVIEQWSDENTFYIWNGSSYQARPGGEAFSGSDFNFGSMWPDPAGMVNTLHDNNMKVLLWQIPVLKKTDYSYEQKDNDEAYMIQQGYAVGDGHGGQYRIPSSGWFGGSLLLDFTNQAAVDWWMSKRAYLFDDIGIDGVKTDGGEMVWGRDTSFYDGSKGPEMRNLYPNTYIKGYNDFTVEKTGEGATFSRSGTSGVQTTGAFWAGDQASSFEAFREAVSAGLSAGVSGIPFWGWDLAGFTGNFPNSELYKRSTQMAAFAPIMQFHSEKADPNPSEERSPWNVQARTGDNTIVPVFQKYVNTRMNLLPYIYSEAQHSADTGSPMMRAMLLDFPDDPNAYKLEEQYMFGRDILVAPILYEGQTVKDVYLPDGEWIDLFHNALTAGGGYKSYYADVDSIPVYVRNGSIIPMNFNSDYSLGGDVGNDVDNYTNLTFRVYPSGTSSYTMTHSDRTTMTVTASENFASGIVTVNIPGCNTPVTTQVFGTEPSGVTVNGTAITKVNSLTEFNQAGSAYYYSKQEKLTYIKTGSAASSIVLNGIYKAPYEAEHAVLTNVATNNNHTGYYGDGFVDQFTNTGDWVEFTVYAAQAGTVTFDARYSAGTEAGQRSISVNGGSFTRLALPKTNTWDTWDKASMPITLSKGRNTVRITYNTGDFAGINLDCIIIR